MPNSATVEAVDILTSAKVNETSNIVEAKIADEQVTGKLTATKTVNNAKPKLGKKSNTPSASATLSKTAS